MSISSSVGTSASSNDSPAAVICDLPVTTDYRDVLIPILRRHTPDADVVRVFPGHEAKPLGQAGEGA